MEANSTPKDINAADEKEDRPDVSQSPAIVDAVDATSTTTPLTPSEVKSSSESTQKPEEANSTAEQKEEVSTNSTLVWPWKSKVLQVTIFYVFNGKKHVRCVKKKTA